MPLGHNKIDCTSCSTISMCWFCHAR